MTCLKTLPTCLGATLVLLLLQACAKADNPRTIKKSTQNMDSAYSIGVNTAAWRGGAVNPNGDNNPADSLIGHYKGHLITQTYDGYGPRTDSIELYIIKGQYDSLYISTVTYSDIYGYTFALPGTVKNGTPYHFQFSINKPDRDAFGTLDVDFTRYYQLQASILEYVDCDEQNLQLAVHKLFRTRGQ